MGRPGEGGGWMACRRRSRQAAGHPRGRPVTRAGDRVEGHSPLVGVRCEAEAGCGAPRVAARPRRQANPNAAASVRFCLRLSVFSTNIEHGLSGGGTRGWTRTAAGVGCGRGPIGSSGRMVRYQGGFSLLHHPVIPHKTNRTVMSQIRLGSCHTRMMHLVSYFAA
jgi:hypothetical protein